MSVKNGNRRHAMPSLAILRCFEASARRESFTLAAEELHLTQSAVSRQVRELEQIVGFPLFRRVGRRVALTEAGRRFADELATDLERLRQTVDRTIASGDEKVALRIASLPTFANRWLIPRLPRFEAEHPDILVSIATRLQPFDFERERFDLAIHFGSDDWPDTRMRRLHDERMVAVASPAFAAGLDLAGADLTDPAQLATAPVLHLETRPGAWQDWFRAVGVTEPPVLRGKRFDQFSMISTAAMASLGAALIPDYLIEDELASGALVKLSERTLASDKSYFVVTPAGERDELRERFIDWIRAELSSVEAA